MATFTTWSALYVSMLDILTDFIITGKFTVIEYEIKTGPTSRHGEYRSFQEVEKALDRVKIMADRESGAAVPRTYAKNVSRFST